MSNHEVYTAECFCGSTQIQLSGRPVAMGYCHCESCRSWSAAPVNGFTLWDPKAVKIMRGAEHVATYNKTEVSHRTWCRKCGGHLFNNHPTMGVIDVYAAVIKGFKFEAALHVNYKESVLPIADGKPKFADMPKEMGGTGALLTQ